MKKVKKTLLAGLSALLLAGAGSVYAQETEQCVPLTRVYAPKTAKQEYNHNKHMFEALKRIERFSPILYDEWVCGDLNIEFIDQKEDFPNAYYSKYNQTIELDCSPNYEWCYLDAIEHELGHHIDNTDFLFHMQFKYVMGQRMNDEDFRAFNTALEKSKWSVFNRKQLQGHAQAYIACRNIGYNLEYGAEMLELGKNLIGDSWEYAVYTTAFSEYEVMSGCTRDLALWLEEQRDQIRIGLMELKDFDKKVYWEQQWETEKPELPQIAIPIAQNFKCAQEGYERALYLLTERIKEEYIPTSNLIKIATVETPNLLMNMVNGSRMLHDEKTNEQFAAAVDSLLTQYAGQTTWAPMRFTLSPNLVDVLATFEYKGEKILAPWAGQYMLNPEVQKYWQENNLRHEEKSVVQQMKEGYLQLLLSRGVNNR
ncbi:hypothetical protein GOV10_05745, partial [Candidatus Woesearchaeota archaeon]|nr:hypothetical protein [Candidatus Woesearchaeota archaeon]